MPMYHLHTPPRPQRMAIQTSGVTAPTHSTSGTQYNPRDTVHSMKTVENMSKNSPRQHVCGCQPHTSPAPAAPQPTVFRTQTPRGLSHPAAKPAVAVALSR